MSDPSSVDRWHPSNVEELARKWENEARGALSINRTHIAKKLAAEQVRDLVPELVADRGRVLAAARELAEAVAHIEAEWVDKPGWLHEPVSVVGVECRNAFAALASFREVDHG